MWSLFNSVASRSRGISTCVDALVLFRSTDAVDGVVTCEQPFVKRIYVDDDDDDDDLSAHCSELINCCYATVHEDQVLFGTELPTATILYTGERISP